MKRLSVNVDHVATIRQARKANEPDPVTAALLVELAGAHGITTHLREDRRHIQDRDLKYLKEMLKVPLNLEMAATDEMVGIALAIAPNLVTLVPENRNELTTEGGLDVIAEFDRLKKTVDALKEHDVEVSLFIDPDLKMIKFAHKLNADRVELHTGQYAEAKSKKEILEQFDRIESAAKAAQKYGLKVNAGHGITYENVSMLSGIREIEEFSIGHTIIARAVLVGVSKAVTDMLLLIQE